MFLKSAFLPRSCLALTLVCVLTLLLPGCATTPEAPQRKPPDARLGPVLNLLKVSIGRDRVRVVSGSSNLVHVLIASTALKQVLDITVQLDGTIEQQVIRSNVSPSTLDGTFDAQGRLHVLIDSEHAVLEDGQWRTSIHTVWQNSGIKAQNPGFAHGAHDLIWTFAVLGNDMGATPGRWVWRGSGGGYPAGGFVVYPWYEKTTKAVLVSETTGRDAQWHIVDPQSEYDTSIVDAASDAAGNIHLVYASGYNLHLAGSASFLDGLLGRHAAEVKLYYARVASNDLQSAGSGKSETPGAVKEVRPLGNISGARLLDWHWTHIDCALAVDPGTGTAMLGNYWLVKGDRWIEVKESSPFPSRPMQIAAAGNDRFHAIAIGNIDARFGGREGIMYSTFSNGEWSGPLWLGITGTASVFNPAVVGMAGAKSGNAFVAWATENGIVGRWIEPNQ